VAKSIGGLFGQGPLGPVFEHLSVVGDALAHLRQVLDAFGAGDHAALAEAAGAVDVAERQADDVKTSIRRRLADSMFAATQRTEVIRLLGAQDDIADHCQRLARLANVRRTACPSAMTDRFGELGEQVLGMGKDLVGAVRTYNAGRSDEAAFALAVGEVAGRQDVCQETLQQVMLTLFEHESASDPLSVIFLMRIAEQLGKIADKVANAAEIYERTRLGSG